MAAMAPALTDAPAEAHRIRFKLAPPSSTLSPSGVEGNGGTSHILVSSNGTVKRKTSEERPARGAGTCKREDPARGDTPQAHLSKIQPLVTSYRCSDVMSVHSHKESLKLQGVLLQNHGILPAYLPRKHQALEEQFKNIISGGSGSGACGSPALQGTPVNGMAKKITKLGPDNKDNIVTLNGGGRHAGQDAPAHTHIVASHVGLRGNGPLRGGADHQCPRDISQDHPSNPESPPSPPLNAPSDLEEYKVSDRLPSLTTDISLASPATSQYSLGGLGTELRDRTQQTQCRQNEIEGRLQRLRKRLQVVQAKQVERHVQQQLGGLLRSTLAPLDALRQQQGRHSTEPLTPQERERLNRVLKAGSVPAELERLSISGSTNLRSAEGAFDSDATESSSGGETDVEEDELTRVDMEQRHIPLWRRAEGRFAVDRAAIISHWNWLQAHVSDLEYRIRQQTDIYRHIRANKGLVLLGESSVCESLGEDSGVSTADNITWPATQVLCGGDGTEGSLLARGIDLEMNLRKGGPPVHQVNGIINSLRSSSLEGAELEEQLTPQQQQQAGSSSDISCVSARTRPVLSCKRRRLLRPSSVTNLNRRVQKFSGPGRCCCEVSGQCVMCCGRFLAPVDPQFQLPLLDRLAQFDPCIHPILSFPDDVGISLHLQRLLKCHWQGRPLEKIKPIKKMSLKHKLPLSSRLPEPSPFSSSKDKHKLTNSLLSTVRLSHHKSRPEKLIRQQIEGSESRQLFRPERSHATFDKSHSRKRPREHSLERAESAPKLYMEMSSPCPSLPSLITPSHSPLIRQLSSSECPTPPCSLNNATPQPIRRRRGESSFDINNIVIPMSVAATTRVEKLQYKEILTPRWREVDITARKIFKDDDLVEVEDLSEAVFTQLHLPYEEQERSRWSWTASAIAKRRGSRSYKSVDGRTTPLLGGTNPSTPQPSSPDTTHFQLLQDYGSATSPSSPASPEMLMFSGPHTPGSRDSHRLLSNEDTRCSTPDTIYEEMVSQPVQPWECRTFPLDVDPVQDYEDQNSPASERPSRTVRRISGCKTGSSRSESDAGPSSPLPEDISKQKANPPLKHTHR